MYQHRVVANLEERLSAWDSFSLWVEDDAVQLGMDLGTYFGLCALNGVLNALVWTRCAGFW